MTIEFPELQDKQSCSTDTEGGARFSETLRFLKKLAERDLSASLFAFAELLQILTSVCLSGDVNDGFKPF